MRLTHVAEFVPDPLVHTFQQANDDWHFNCGPGAVCGVCKLTPDQVRPYFEHEGFGRKHYTNPTMMRAVLNWLGGHGITYEWKVVNGLPKYGLARVQWGGPWMRDGVPLRARYRHTHWIGFRTSDRVNGFVFDVNAACVGGWLPFPEWDEQLVPWLLKQTEPKADGTWSITHCVEIKLPGGTP